MLQPSASSRGPLDDGSPAIRRLFLDDDPERAALFLAEFPDAAWVTTAAGCIERLAEPWDEVHLDHDLNGEQYVDPGRDDCGMEVVRWLAAEPRRHLKTTRFLVHSHNGVAAYVMELQLKGIGLRAKAAPFGAGLWKRGSAPPPRRPSLLGRIWKAIGRRGPAPDP